MIRVLVTGGAGFIGSHLVDRLLAAGHEVVVVDDLSQGRRANLPAEAPRLRFIEADVAGIEDLAREIAGTTLVFHLAALISSHDSLETPAEYLRVNQGGLLALLRLCRGLPRPRVVFASSATVYGVTPGELKAETDLPAPATVYALTKLAGEHLLGMYRERYGFDDVSLRLFNVYGPRQSTNHPYANVTCKFAHAAARGLPVKLYGDGEQTRDFVYVDDAVDALLAAAERPTPSRVYNVGTGEAASINALFSLVEAVAGTKLTVERCPPWPNDIRAIRADTSRLATELGVRARVALGEGLKRTVEHFRATPS